MMCFSVILIYNSLQEEYIPAVICLITAPEQQRSSQSKLPTIGKKKGKKKILWFTCWSGPKAICPRSMSRSITYAE